jgi:hypothetical protein
MVAGCSSGGTGGARRPAPSDGDGRPASGEGGVSHDGGRGDASVISDGSPPTNPNDGSDANQDSAGDDGSIGEGPTACTPPASSTILEPIVPVVVGKSSPLADSPLEQRPFFVKGSGNTGKADALLTSFTEQQWRALVPTQSPREVGVKCPADGSTAFTWSPNTPNQISCGGQTYPNGADNRTTESIEVLSGKMIKIPVWPVVGGGTSKLGMMIDRKKSVYLYAQLEVLAAAYVGTGDQKYARRIAITLDEWAKYLPDYVLTGVNGTNLLPPSELTESASGPFGRLQRVSDHNGISHEIVGEWVTAMDAIYADSSLWSDLDDELGYDVRQRIIDDLVMNTLDFVLNKIDFRAHGATNLAFPYTIASRWAIVLGRPDVIEWLNSYLRMIVRNLLRDGMNVESFMYGANFLLENVKVTSEMLRFFEVWPASPTLAPIHDRVLTYEAALKRGLSDVDLVREPDGSMAPFGNTSLSYADARTESHSQLLPAYGHLTFGDGKNSEQSQVNMGFEDRGNHCEEDVLSFVLYDASTELLGDIRYSRMAGRPFTEASMGHNTVTVNRTTQSRSNHQPSDRVGHLFTGGDVLFFEPNLAGISAAEVDGARAYIGAVERYQRLMIHNTTDPARPYVVDLFRVKGGTTHDYFLHGSTRWDSVTPPPDATTPPATSSLSLTHMTGNYPLLEGNETWSDPPPDNAPWYGAFRDVWTARSSGAWDVTFKELTGDRGTRMFMVDNGDIDVFVAKSPSPFRTASPNDKDPKTFYAYWRPSLLARHRTQAGADTLFAAVIEPLHGASVISKVERLKLETDNRESIALGIDFKDGRHDVVLAALSDPATGQPAAGSVTTADGKFSLSGRVGVWSSVPGSRAHLIGGNAFNHPDGALSIDKAIYEGTITGAARAAYGCGVNALITDTALPQGTALAGRRIRATFDTYDVVPTGTTYPGGIKQQKGFTQLYLIDHVLVYQGKTYVVLAEDPGLLFEGSTIYETARPFRSFTGSMSFEIDLSVSN